ncbi:MAG: MBL fold metallo-hydrolase [Xylanivirga thermophila]|jgi:phosphoribosyl 1,2-cyclic phosphodiesterase|uniref:MBL fold metallo-hydrolase n=1 Tax=Xylanivirga thermophila TaxID=2496273 RepID=UPI0039F531E1
MRFSICSLFSGSSGNCTYVGSEDTHILVDCGCTGKKVMQSLDQIGVDSKAIDAILITHEHTDHIQGAGVLSRKLNVPIYANEDTWNAMRDKVGKIDEKNIRIFSNDMDFYIKDINIEPYQIPHDAANPVGFCLYCGNKKISITTDLGYTNNKIINKIMDSDLVVLESNHDIDMLKAGPYPFVLKRRILGKKGHLSNTDAGKAITELINGKVTHVLLGHLSRQNNLPELAYQTVVEILTSNGIKPGSDLVIDMTYRDQVGNFYHLGA